MIVLQGLVIVALILVAFGVLAAIHRVILPGVDVAEVEQELARLAS